MIVVGLTGSIGMGKTTVAAQFAELGAAVCSADNIVHQLLGSGGKAVVPVGQAFPGVIKAGAVDRKALGQIVFNDKAKLKQLEGILHPLVVEEEDKFIAWHKEKGTDVVVLEIPLLFETGGEKRCNVTVVTTAPHFIQRQRVMSRPNMTAEKFKSILASQMSDKEKRQRADFVIQTGIGKAYSFRKVAALMRILHAA